MSVGLISEGDARELLVKDGEGKEFFREALKEANRLLKDEPYKVALVDESKFDPAGAIDLKLVYKDKETPIDFVNLIEFPLCTESKGKFPRLTSGKKELKAFAQEIADKARQHVDAESDKNILIAKSGAKHSVQHLEKTTLSIDPQDYLRVEGYRVLRHGGGGPLSASSLRSDTIIIWKKKGDRLEVVDDKDPAPSFYIHLKEYVTAEPEYDQGSKYLQLSRDTKA